MFVGHGFIAFALAAGAAHAAGWERERALAVGAVAGLFGLAPDVDMAYALVGLLGADGAMDAATGFWSASTAVHRVVTHSFLVGAVAALAAGGLVARRHGYRIAASALLTALVLVAALATGALGAGVMALFVLVVAALALAARRLVGPRTVAAAAAVGLLSHPPGDLLTGEPPAFLYPLDTALVAARPTVFADATLNLLAPLYLELATFWLALAVYLVVTDGVPSLRPHLRGRAALGLAFASVAVLAPPPTLDVSYHFVFPLVGIGVATAAPLPVVEVTSLGDLREQPLAVAVTGLAAVTLAVVAYTGAYLLW